MGNSSSKPKNKLKVGLSVRKFAIHALPQKPAQWAQRIDHRMWEEFITCCRNAATLPDAAERKAEYDKWFCYFWLGFAGFFIGIALACGLGIPGGIEGNTAMWVFAIIFGVFGFLGGMILFIVASNKYGEINRQFIQDVKSNVSQNLSFLNNKYGSMIRFSSKGTGIFQGKEDANSTVRINIEIELLVDRVEYIPDAHQGMVIGNQQSMLMQNPVIQQQQQPMQLQMAPQAQQGQVIMVQMPDGRMVPAQIQGTVAQQPQPVQQVVVPQYQQQPQQVQQVVVPQPSGYNNQPQQVVAPSPYAPGGGQVEPQQIQQVVVPPPYNPDEEMQPSYNPEANGIQEQNEGGGGGEGGKPTNGGFNYQ